MYDLDDTIVAIATVPGAAARGILRISGPAALDCLARCFQARSNGSPSHSCKFQTRSGAARVYSGTLLGSLRLPCDLYLWPSARSYTRQPLAEFHTLGSPPLLDAVLRVLCEHGARLAQPGEFTLRAFLAGRLDLTQAEAVLGVIDAHDRRELSTALAQLAGGLSGPLGVLRGELLDLLADLEAGLDFVDEHLEFVTHGEVVERLTRAAHQVASVAEQLVVRGRAGREFRIAVIGLPNVGKSSLFNALAARDAALVSQESGTTRDYLEAPLSLGGLACRLIDTAGFETVDEPAAMAGRAQRMTAQQHEQADLRILCLDSTRELRDWERERLHRDSQLVVLTKCDQPRVLRLPTEAICTSAYSGEGLSELRAAIAQRLIDRNADGRAVASTAVRCADSVRRAGESLTTALDLARTQAGDELVAAELRIALAELGRVVGAVYTEDVLDRIFSRFCIGK